MMNGLIEIYDVTRLVNELMDYEFNYNAGRKVVG